MATDEEITEAEELFFRGSDLHGEGELDQAMECFDKCLELDPGYTDALLGKAMVHAAREEFDEAVDLAKQMVRLNPDDALGYTNLSVFYQKMGRIEDAEEAGAKARMADWKRQLGEDEE